MRDKRSLNRNIWSAPLYLFTPFLGTSILGFSNPILILTSLTFIGKMLICLNKLKLDLHKCSSQDTTIALYLVMTLVLISFLFFFFTQYVITRFSSRVPLYCIAVDQINKLPEDGLKSLPEKSRYIENTWISMKKKIKIKLCFLAPY